MRELFIGASLSEPHIDGTFMHELFINYIYIYMYVWYDRHPRHRSYTIHCAHSIVFRAIQTACCNVCVLHCASVQHALPRVQARIQASFKLRMRFSSNRDR